MYIEVNKIRNLFDTITKASALAKTAEASAKEAERKQKIREYIKTEILRNLYKKVTF